MDKIFIYLFKLYIFGMMTTVITHTYCTVGYKIVEWNSNKTTKHFTSSLNIYISWPYYMLTNNSLL